MGFGILFVGYFLILNFAYPAFTDMIAAAVMMYGFYKLSGVNRGFRTAVYLAAALAVFGLSEFGIKVADMFFAVGMPDAVATVMAAARHLLVALVTVAMLFGIKEVAREVELYALETKAKSSVYATLLVYALLIFVEAGAPAFVPVEVMAGLSTFVLLASLALIIFNLTIIYGAYMRICMPEELDAPDEPKESRFGFVNEYRRHQEEKTREYAEYKLEKMKRKAEKQKRSKK